MLHTNKNSFFMASGQKLLGFAKQPKLYNWNFRSDNFYSLFFKANLLTSKKLRNLQIKRFAQEFANTYGKKINKNGRTNLRRKAERLSGEIFKESFIDILHTNFEQVAFSAPPGGYFFGEKPLELTKTIERKANVDFSTEKIWRSESKITREHTNRRLSKAPSPSLHAVPYPYPLEGVRAKRGKEGQGIPIILNKKIGDYLSSGDKIGSFLLNEDLTSFPFSISENSGSFRSFLLFLGSEAFPLRGEFLGSKATEFPVGKPVGFPTGNSVASLLRKPALANLRFACARKSYVPSRAVPLLFFLGKEGQRGKSRENQKAQRLRCQRRFFTKSCGYKKRKPYTFAHLLTKRRFVRARGGPYSSVLRTTNSKISKGFLLPPSGRPEKPYDKTLPALGTLVNPKMVIGKSLVSQCTANSKLSLPISFGKKKHKLKAAFLQNEQAFDKFNFLRITKSYKNKKTGDKAFQSSPLFSRSCFPLSCYAEGVVKRSSTKKHSGYQNKTRYDTANFYVKKRKGFFKETPQAFSCACKSKICKRKKKFAIPKRDKEGIEKAKEGAHPIILNCSGRILAISKTELVLQKTQPVLFYNTANLHVKKGEWVKEGSPILTLTHQTLITGDIVQGIPRIEQLFEAFTSPPSAFKDRERSVTKFQNVHDTLHSQVRDIFRKHWFKSILPIAVRKSLEEIQYILVESIQKVYLSQGVLIADKHIEIIIRQIASKGQILDSGTTGLFLEEVLPIRQIENANLVTPGKKCLYVPAVVGLTAAALSSDSFISAASFQETTRVLSRDAFVGKSDFLRGLKEKVVIGDLISAGTGLDIYFIYTTMMAR